MTNLCISQRRLKRKITLIFHFRPATPQRRSTEFARHDVFENIPIRLVERAIKRRIVRRLSLTMTPIRE